MSLRLAVQQPYTMARLPPQARGVAIHYNRRRDEDMRSQEEDRRRREDDEQRKKADEQRFLQLFAALTTSPTFPQAEGR